MSELVVRDEVGPIYVCSCLASFTDDDAWYEHFEACPMVQYDPVKEINEGRHVDAHHPSDPFMWSLQNCSHCNASMFDELLAITAKGIKAATDGQDDAELLAERDALLEKLVKHAEEAHPLSI